MNHGPPIMRWALGLLVAIGATSAVNHAATSSCGSATRTIRADVVAFDQVITYNRYGSINPVGMMYALKEDVVASTGSVPGPGNAKLNPNKRPRPLVLRANVGDCLTVTFYNWLKNPTPSTDSPADRWASMHVNGMVYDTNSDGGWAGNNINTTIQPSTTPITYSWYADKEGSYLVTSEGALAGGEGDGGSTVHGLFGTVVVEPAGSIWYRSQLTASEMTSVRTLVTKNPPVYSFNYNKLDANSKPVVKILDSSNRIRYSEINAIIDNVTQDCSTLPTGSTCGKFREFVVIFHDELKTIHNYCVLNPAGEGGPYPAGQIPDCTDDNRKRFHATRDGFGVNYGASGIGPILLSKMNNTGPAKNCPECVYEEFFLTSWANGDPALLTQFPSDPSNVHHSYIGDPVRFRNLHAGPFETHIFHLHAHQWLHEELGDNSTYLDSQTVGPGTAYDYNIMYGGGGNRNQTVGDAIFHCHLYPHFAQGMWELWRNHDVFEDGSAGRNLPDGDAVAYPSGTPNPAIMPISGLALAPWPTTATPGYPFFMGGTAGAVAGHRPPQAPLDLEQTGGLPRHIVLTGTKTANNMADPNLMFCQSWVKANLKLIPTAGTALEQGAMTFHANAAGHPTSFPNGTTAGAIFKVNGRPAVAGAPFADPCPASTPTREYRAAAIQINLRANEDKWHDPQARINVLNDDVTALVTSAGTSEGRMHWTANDSVKADPFFIRANSGECINFHHSNLTPAELKEDAFQVCLPTDTIGQHIHLVKFDVTSSDGSGNGWNYEDGTFANDEVKQRINAYNTFLGTPTYAAVNNPAFPGLAGMEALGAQTTVQRWWADPLMNAGKQDRTLRTVFTHDHFGASTIQQHGFYGALIIEPVTSLSTPTIWKDPYSGTQLGTRADGGPTRPDADIIIGGSGDLDGDSKVDHFREYSLAVADFALLLDSNENEINPPDVPEALSSEDPGSMLLNYRNDPIPLRISNDHGSTQAGGAKGDMANVFSSCVHGRDPWTPLVMAYEGDSVKFRLIQGAQEEQHSFSINGFRWPFEPSEPKSGYRASQAIGISEHFEFVAKAPYACPATRRITDAEMDRLAWETREDLMGPFNPDKSTGAALGEFAAADPVDPGPDAVGAALDLRLNAELESDGTASKVSKSRDAVNRMYNDPVLFSKLENGEEVDSYETAREPNPENRYTERKRRRQCFSDYQFAGQALDDLWNGDWGLLRVYKDCQNKLKPLPGSFCASQPAAVYQNPVTTGYSCLSPNPAEPNPCGATPVTPINVTAIAKSITYNGRESTKDPTGLVFVPDADVAAVQAGTKAPEPLVIRANPGECLAVKLTNRLPRNVPDRNDDAIFPEIVSMNVDDLRPSRRVSLHPQLVDFNVRNSDGTAIGFNPDQTVPRNHSYTYRWYVPTDLSAPRDPGSIPVAGPESLGAANLRDYGDIMKHGSQGLIGGLILEPPGYNNPPGGNYPRHGQAVLMKANVGSGLTDFRDFVLFYQDGLNLRNYATNQGCIPDNEVFLGFHPPVPPGVNACRQADPEDQGNRAWSYRTEPFWSRLAGCANDPYCVLNAQQQHDVFQAFNGTPETPKFTAMRGEKVRLRVLQPDGRARQHSFTLSGHTFPNEPSFAPSMTLGGIAGLSVSIHKDLVLNYGAGGKDQNLGSWLMREMGNTQLEGGMWGVLEVTTTKPADVQQTTPATP